MYTRVRNGGGCRGRTGGVDHGRGEHGIHDLGFGGNVWVVPISVACILACFIIAVSTLALLVLYIWNSTKPSSVTAMAPKYGNRTGPYTNAGYNSGSH